MESETPKKTQHTPGPWEAILPGDERGQPQAMYSGLVALISTDPAIGIKRVSVVTDGRVTWEPEWEANARLIAAAPELLEACERLCKSMHPHPVEHPSMFAAKEHALAVIAKARR